MSAIWNEGVRCPVPKLVDAGKERRDVVLSIIAVELSGRPRGDVSRGS